MSEKPKKTRISVTVTDPILVDLDNIIKDGFHLTRGGVILDAFRHFREEYYYLRSLTTREPPEEPQ